MSTEAREFPWNVRLPQRRERVGSRGRGCRWSAWGSRFGRWQEVGGGPQFGGSTATTWHIVLSWSQKITIAFCRWDGWWYNLTPSSPFCMLLAQEERKDRVGYKIIMRNTLHQAEMKKNKNNLLPVNWAKEEILHPIFASRSKMPTCSTSKLPAKYQTGGGGLFHKR